MDCARKTILLTGKNGQLGWELKRTLTPLGKVIAIGSDDANLTDAKTVKALIETVQPDVIVNTAAYTQVDEAESKQEYAMLVNAKVPQILAHEALRRDILLVHYSTDYVFDGSKSTPYVEKDIPNPLNIYGHSKLAGERAILQSGCRHLIFRIAWMYSERGNNFFLTIKRLASERELIRVVDDQRGSPTWCRMVAIATALVLSQQKAYSFDCSGIYHMVCQGRASWYEFACAILAGNTSETSRKVQVIPVSTAEYPTKAKRPPFSCLSSCKLMRTFGVILPEWDQALAMALQEYKK